MNVENVAIDKLIPYEFNNKVHNVTQVNRIANSIKEFGFLQPIVIDKDNVIVVGHGRLEGAKKLGLSEVPCVRADDLTEAQIKKYRILDNKLNESERNIDNLKLELDELGDLNIGDIELSVDDVFPELDKMDMANKGYDGVGNKGALLEKFGIAPFSILDTTSSVWIQRKRTRISLGIQSEIGRDKGLTYNKKLSSVIGKTGTSIFDPVLCELCYKRFNVDGGTIIDPFAGGSVRGIVAGKLKFPYFGNDLSETQIIENRKQGDEIISEEDGDIMPVWSIGDSQEIGTILDGVEADMIFSCPPYADLEVYSDDPKDLSNMEYEGFLKCYKNIINETCKKLKENRFAVFVVSEVRGKKGDYYGFVSDTIKAFEEAGLKYYNEIILENAIGTLAITIARNFCKRKIGRRHQNVLVFYKGDLDKIKENFGDIDMSEFLEAVSAQYDDLSEMDN